MAGSAADCYLPFRSMASIQKRSAFLDLRFWHLPHQKTKGLPACPKATAPQTLAAMESFYVRGYRRGVQLCAGTGGASLFSRAIYRKTARLGGDLSGFDRSFALLGTPV